MTDTKLTTAIQEAEKAADEALDSLRDRLHELQKESQDARDICRVLTTKREPSEKMEQAIRLALDALADGKPQNGRPPEGEGESVNEELREQLRQREKAG